MNGNTAFSHDEFMAKHGHLGTNSGAPAGGGGAPRGGVTLRDGAGGHWQGQAAWQQRGQGGQGGGAHTHQQHRHAVGYEPELNPSRPKQLLQRRR